MQFSFAKSCLLALASISAVVAQTTPGFDVMSEPVSGQVLPADQVYTITWTPSTVAGQTGPITITLLQGKDPASLQTSVVIASAIDSAKGSFAWKIPTTLTDSATFGFDISLDSNPAIFQYSFPFKISGLSGSTGTGTGSTTTSTVAGSTVTQQITQISTVTSTTSSSIPTSSHSSTLSTTTSSAAASKSTTTSAASTSNSTTSGAAVSVSSTPTTSASSASNTTGPAITHTPNAAAHAAIGGTAVLGIGMFFAAML